MSINYEAVALSMIESWLGRTLGLAERTERYPAAARVTLKGWPVTALTGLRPTGNWKGAAPSAEALLQDAWVDGDRGIVTMPALANAVEAQERAEWRSRNASEADGPELEITYTAGYAVLPDAIKAAEELLAAALRTADENGGQQITYQALDGYQVTYASKYTEGGGLSMLSPAAAILIEPYKARA